MDSSSYPSHGIWVVQEMFQSIMGRNTFLVIVDDIQDSHGCGHIFNKTELLSKDEFIHLWMQNGTMLYSQIAPIVYNYGQSCMIFNFLRVFGDLCYPTNDANDLGNFKPNADIGICVDNAPVASVRPELIMRTLDNSIQGSPHRYPCNYHNISTTDIDLEIVFSEWTIDTQSMNTALSNRQWVIVELSLDPTFLPQGRAPVGGVTIRDPVSKTTSKLHEVVGKGKAVVTEEQVAHSLIDLSKKKRTTDQFILVRRDQTPPDSTTGPSSQPDDDTSEKVIHESSSSSDSERTESETEAAAPKGDKDQDEVDTSTVTSGVSIPVSDPEKAHEALAGPDPEPMKEDQTGSDSGKLHVSLAGPNPEHMDDEFLATAYPKVHENLKLITDERVIDDKPESHSGSMSSMKNLDDTFNFGDQFLHDKPTEDDQEKSKVREESDSTIPDSSHQTVTSTPPVIAPFTEVLSSKPSLLVTPPPINTEATTITTSLPEITPFIALQLRVAKLEQEMSEVKKTDHSADVLASIRSQVPTAVNNYLGTKLDDALLKVLDPTTYKVHEEKFSVLLGLESVKNQESKKSPKEIIKVKKEQDKVKTHEKSMIVMMMKTMMMMKALQLGSNQGRSTKRRRSDSAASGSAKPPPKADDQSSKKPRESEASASKQHPSLSSTGWQITDTRVWGMTQKMEDTDNAHISQEEGNSISTNTLRSSDRKQSDRHMRILSVGSVKVILTNLHPNDFGRSVPSIHSRKAQPLPKTDKTSLHTAVNMWIRNLVIRNRVGDLQLGIESYQTKINLERPNWDAADYYLQ
ncbi:hypothetical protein Tco_0204941 [Tanacetum coccineum]